jgi:ketosteroid isomerase-like protein
MNRKRMIAVAVALGVCGIANAQEKPAPAMWDAAAAKEARAVVERGLAAVEKMDVEGVKAVAAQDITAYDIDLENKPVRMKSLAEVTQYLEAIFTEVKGIGATVKFENRTTECRATATMAYCTFEYDFVAMMADGTKMAQPSQTTVVLRKGNDGWKWAHWHTSLSVLPAAPAAPGAK